MKRIIITALLVSAGWWYFNQPDPAEEPYDRTSKIVVHDTISDTERVIWERD